MGNVWKCERCASCVPRGLKSCMLNLGVWCTRLCHQSCLRSSSFSQCGGSGFIGVVDKDTPTRCVASDTRFIWRDASGFAMIPTQVSCERSSEPFSLFRLVNNSYLLIFTVFAPRLCVSARAITNLESMNPFAAPSYALPSSAFRKKKGKKPARSLPPLLARGLRLPFVAARAGLASLVPLTC